MYETLLRPHHVETAPPLTPISVVGDRLKQSEARREEKRLRQIANARAGAERRASKRKADEDDTLEGEEKEGKRVKADVGAGDGVRVAPEVQAQDEREAEVAAGAQQAMDTDGGVTVKVEPTSSAGLTAGGGEMVVRPETEAETEPQKITLSKTFPEVRGHTSYLTFAVLLPATVMSKVVENASEQPSTVGSAQPTPPPPSALEVSLFD